MAKPKEADFSKFLFKHGDTVMTPQGVILGIVIARLFIEGSGGGVSRAYSVRGYDSGACNRFEYELCMYQERLASSFQTTVRSNHE